MAKFIPPPDQINSISSKKTKKSFSDNSGQSIFSEVKKLVKESYSTDAFEQVGQMNAVVLERREVDVISMLWRSPLMYYQFTEKGSIPDYFEIRFRIPELHAHLPEPKGPDDYKAINLHPIAIMKKNKGMPEPGDVVVLDFQDKNNFKGAVVIETLNTNDPNKNPGGNCSASSTGGAASAAPPLNMTAPSGDGQVSTPDQYSASNSPASDSRSSGISYPNTSQSTGGGFFVDPDSDNFSLPSSDLVPIIDPSTGATIGYEPISYAVEGSELPFIPDSYKPIIFTISIDDYKTLPDFKNVDNLAENLLSKRVAAVCFSVAEGKNKLRNLNKLRKIIKKLTELNIDVGVSISMDDISSGSREMPQFYDNFIHMSEIVKSTSVKFVLHDIVDNTNSSGVEKIDIVFRNFCDSLNLKYYALVTHKTERLSTSSFIGSASGQSGRAGDSVAESAVLFPVRTDRIFAAANLYDYNNRPTRHGGAPAPEDQGGTPIDPGTNQWSPYHQLSSRRATADFNYGFPNIPTKFFDTSTNQYNTYVHHYDNTFDNLTTNSTNWLPMYHLDGANFIYTPSEPCVAGERTNAILEKDFEMSWDADSMGINWGSSNAATGFTGHNIESLELVRNNSEGYHAGTVQKHLIIMSGYGLLTEDKSKFIYEKLFPSSTAGQSAIEFENTQKQNFLNSLNNVKTTDKAKVDDIVGSLPSTVANIALEQPSFNTGSSLPVTGGTGGAAPGASTGGDSSQSADGAPAAEHDSKPGIQCTPIPTVEPMPGGAAGGGGPGAAVEPPSFRFDSIENYSNLGWTANNSAAINNVIFEFMEKFSAAVYRRLPQNSPSFTGSNPKKIRLTSTARTFEKQVELMWDKIKNGGGDQAVYGLYGNKDWTRAVVNAYHANNQPAAVQAVKDRVNNGGGSAHLKGKGVDVHTWSHINAEGMNSDGATVAQMNNSKFVQAVVEAAKEVGASPVVEAYQQHVHITIF